MEACLAVVFGAGLIVVGFILMRRGRGGKMTRQGVAMIGVGGVCIFYGVSSDVSDFIPPLMTFTSPVSPTTSSHISIQPLLCLPFCMGGLLLMLGVVGLTRWVNRSKLPDASPITYAPAPSVDPKVTPNLTVPVGVTVYQIYALSPVEFERYIKLLFEKQGYRVKHVGGSNDHGVDLLLKMGNQRAVVQCKCYDPQRRIGPEVVRELRGTMYAHRVTRGYLVTTADFSPGATQEAEAIRSHEIKLINGEKVALKATALGLPPPVWH